ncbi:MULTISPECIES: cytochrome b [Pseudovibrio]|uniref:cytochrome b n=1 Tax=Stappiaceae TaxID=2821832 RepID=UPI002365A8A5|nr:MULTISPECIES: cytochrome b [Pseudovibrio]MDD7909898.1 cytochrome b [Pseudovibrio exalbescens]MDX5592235.1 cytochrome b [Pseudovibrio sp. SPO723]
MQPPQVYSVTARAFHWITAAGMLTMVPAGIVMINIGPGNLQNTLFDYHRSMGVVLFVITAMRLLYRYKVPPPPLPSSIAIWQRTLAHATQWFLYMVLLVSPLLGWVATSAFGAPISVFNLFILPPIVAKDQALAEILFSFHTALGIMVSVAIVLHIAGALYHKYVLKDGVFERMTTGTGAVKNTPASPS